MVTNLGIVTMFVMCCVYSEFEKANSPMRVPAFQMLTWDVGKINPQKLPSLKGSMSLQAGASKPDENPSINIQFKIQQMAISGTHTRTLARAHIHTITF
jgi:hypothetical protein